MPWYFLMAAAIGLSVDTFVLSAAYSTQDRKSASMVALAVVCTCASVAMLMVGAALTSSLAAGLEFELPDLGNVLIAGLGLFLLGESLRGRCDQQHRRCSSKAILCFAVLLSTLDSAAFGSSLSLSGEPILPMAIAVGFTSSIASIAGSLIGHWTQATIGEQAQAYGGMVLISLGAVGAIA